MKEKRNLDSRPKLNHNVEDQNESESQSILTVLLSVFEEISHNQNQNRPSETQEDQNQNERKSNLGKFSN